MSGSIPAAILMPGTTVFTARRDGTVRAYRIDRDGLPVPVDLAQAVRALQPPYSEFDPLTYATNTEAL